MKTTINMFSFPTEDVEKLCIPFLVAFRRWAASRSKDCVLPPEFADHLKGYLSEPNFSMQLDDTFHLRAQVRTSSSIGIYGFSLPSNNKQLLQVRCVRSNYNDTHTLHVMRGHVKSHVSHNMVDRPTRKNSSLWTYSGEDHPPVSARELLLDRWFSIDRWLHGEHNPRYVFVRPKDKDLEENQELSFHAKKILERGYSILLFTKRDLVCIPLVGRERLMIAGFLWRDPPLAKENHGASGVPDGFSLILAEGCRPDGRCPDLFDEKGMLRWDMRNVYAYHKGPWH